jgi:hypothetical protein
MNKHTFSEVIIKNLCSYYERKAIPTESARDLWYAKIRNIPDESAQWIVNRIQDTQEAFPRNLPAMIWGMYREWLDSHPDKQARQQRVKCPDCNGDGYVFVITIDKESNPHEYVFRCPVCDQAAEIGIPYWDRIAHEAAGYQRLLPGEGIYGRVPLADLTAMVAKTVNDALPF